MYLTDIAYFHPGMDVVRPCLGLINAGPDLIHPLLFHHQFLYLILFHHQLLYLILFLHLNLPGPDLIHPGMGIIHLGLCLHQLLYHIVY